MSNFGPVTSAGPPTYESPDSLPLKGFTKDALCQYIYRSLGAPTWEVELTKQQVLDSVNDALGLYSQWVPNESVGNIILTRGRYRYLEGADVDQGISRIDFVEPVPVPYDVLYTSLISPAPMVRTGLDDYDTFLRWRKLWQRVTSTRPDWLYDDTEQVLYIHNPIERYQAGVFFYTSFTDTRTLSLTGAQWVKEFALETSRYKLGELYSKYSGAIPGPLQNLQLDQQKRDKAEVRLQALREKLVGMQKSTPCMID